MWTRGASVSLQGRQIHLCGCFSTTRQLDGHKEQAGFSHRERGERVSFTNLLFLFSQLDITKMCICVTFILITVPQRRFLC